MGSDVQHEINIRSANFSSITGLQVAAYFVHQYFLNVQNICHLKSKVRYESKSLILAVAAFRRHEMQSRTTVLFKITLEENHIIFGAILEQKFGPDNVFNPIFQEQDHSPHIFCGGNQMMNYLLESCTFNVILKKRLCLH